MRERVRDIVRLGDSLFSKRYPIMSLWQTQAENFHVMRADFTRRRYFSEEFGSYLMSGRPARCHRDLMNSFSTMLRRDQWFHARTDSETINEDRDAKMWLDWASKTMRRAMYDKRSGFIRSTKTADGDFCAFGNAVITRDVVDYDHLLYRDWHLRDVAWEQNYKRAISTVHFDWKPYASQLVEQFPKTVHPSVLEVAKKRDENAFREIQCRRFLIPADNYDLAPSAANRGKPFVSVYVDCENEVILEEVALRTWPVTIARWEFGGSMYGNQYGYSPPVVYGLPDSRMYQQMMLSMLTASEMATYPAMIAVGEAINGAINLYAAGITQTDADYDERTGDVLRPITTDFSGIKFGADQMERLEAALDDAFLLNKIRLPQIDPKATAYQVSKIYEQFIRESLPLFEPVNDEYNTHLVDGTFQDLLNLGTFGSPDDMPQILRGRDVSWQFDTPISTAVEAGLTQSFEATVQSVVQGAQIDPKVRMNVDWNQATRDAVSGTGAPAKWLLPEDQVKQMQDQEAQQEAAQQQANQVAHGADVASRVGDAARNAGDAMQSLRQAGVA